MCNNCIHQPVCSIYRATGGVKKCKYFNEAENLFAAVCRMSWEAEREN